MYAVGSVKHHPFVDGKRTGFLAAYGFLKINGYALRVAEAVVMTKQLAASDINESQFAAWLEDNSKAI